MARDINDDTAINGFEDLVDYLAGGSKNAEKWRIGTEHEKFPFFLEGNRPVPYNGRRSIRKLLEGMQNMLGWEPIMDEGNIIGLVEPTGAGAISLEPGGQFELSGAPLKTVHQTCREVNAHLAQVKEIAEPLGIRFLGLGASPKWRLDETPRMPKSRYRIMANYMPKVGRYGLDMMYRTCTIQVNLDFSSESDMRRKMQVSMKLQSIATALFATSPFSEGKPNGFMSWRSEIWRDTDNRRSGVLPFVFNENFGFADYAAWALDIPMYFIVRDGHYHDCTNITFRQFMDGAMKGVVDDYHANMGDWVNHLSTLFPEVRLKRFLEMRGADGGPWRRICALPAFWVGLLYDKQALDEAYDMTRDWCYEEVLAMRNRVPALGLKTPFRNTTVLTLAREILEISRKGLVNRHQLNAKGNDETLFLDPLFEVAMIGKCDSERLLSKYDSIWGGSVDPVFLEYAY
ncbi:glutamate--cysteine ligase [uncultured Bartonella sp.]|uniref:glutamate--cysteine ligase n=1 Tax=uncultured Bartonella sp. TaxID=104108 RepID=UPI0026277913|nr:glutamate--cysteine ligase [uncultured Bartonella sp.]